MQMEDVPVFEEAINKSFESLSACR